MSPPFPPQLIHSNGKSIISTHTGRSIAFVLFLERRSRTAIIVSFPIGAINVWQKSTTSFNTGCPIASVLSLRRRSIDHCSWVIPTSNDQVLTKIDNIDRFPVDTVLFPKRSSGRHIRSVRSNIQFAPQTINTDYFRLPVKHDFTFGHKFRA